MKWYRSLFKFTMTWSVKNDEIATLLSSGCQPNIFRDCYMLSSMNYKLNMDIYICKRAGWKYYFQNIQGNNLAFFCFSTHRFWRILRSTRRCLLAFGHTLYRTLLDFIQKLEVYNRFYEIVEDNPTPLSPGHQIW